MMEIDQNPAFLYGESVFVTCKVENGTICFWNEHLERLLKMARAYFFLSDDDCKSLELDVHRKVSQLNLNSGSLRMTIHGRARDFFKARFTANELLVTALLRPYKLPTAPWKIKTFYRGQDSHLDHLKIGSYGKEFYLKRLALEQGFDEVLFVDHEKVYELSTSNIFFTKGEVLITPKSGIYQGLMREKILQENQVEVRDVYLHELKSFDGAFATNCLIGKHPVIIEGAW
jgi:branched-chain amino acid aminotransferase